MIVRNLYRPFFMIFCKLTQRKNSKGNVIIAAIKNNRLVNQGNLNFSACPLNEKKRKERSSLQK